MIHLADYKCKYMELIGREEEQKTFKHCLQATESKLIAVYGRRRVGKTFLIRKYFAAKLRFEIAGLYKGNMKDQLTHFGNTLIKSGYYNAAIAKPNTWMQAFELLGQYLNSLQDKQKKAILIDELPWFDTPRSKFLMAFEHFWNEYCTKRNDLLVVICGSAASWMIKKILKNKGGLHNRVAEKIRLRPFNLYETEKFLKQKGIQWSRYDIAQLYLTTGGIPFYLDAVRKGESVIQFVDRACFQENGVLINEYTELFESLYDHSVHHHTVVTELAKVKKGLNRDQIINKTKLPSGGTLTKVLDELEKSGFINLTTPYQMNKNGVLYQLVDFFTLFYFKYMITGSKDRWLKKVQLPTWRSWAGLAFEHLCFAHIRQIKRALGLEVIESEISTWSINEAEGGAQIDLIIDRADHVINICEIKFSTSEYRIDKVLAANLRNKLARFATVPINKKKSLSFTMITTFGILDNEYYKELVQSEVTLDDLFER